MSDHPWPPIILPGDFPGLTVDGQFFHKPEDLSLNVIEDAYELDFYKKDHVNYICKEGARNFVVSVNSKCFKPFHYMALKTTEKGYDRFDIELSGSTGGSFEEMVFSYLKDKNPNVDIFQVTDEKFPDDFLILEQKHAQKRIVMKIGVVYCKEGQSNGGGPAMFKNKPEDCGPGFWQYIDVLGKKIDLEGWTRYRGDMRPPGYCWFDEWRDIEVCYHIAPILNSEEKRRLIGNDIAMIFYYDAPTSSQFDLSGIDTFGEVPQVFTVVQPNDAQPDSYRVGFFSKKNITPHLPGIPVSEAFFNGQKSKELILTKLYNGLVLTSQCPPMNRLFLIPRRATLQEIVDKYPKPDPAKHQPSKPAQTKGTGGFFRNMSGVAKIASEKAAGVADRVETQKIRGTLVEGFNTLKDTTQQTMQGGTETEVYVPPDPEPIVMKLRTMQAGYDISWNPETVGYTFSNALALLNGCILTTFSSEDSKRWGPILAQAPPKNILSFEGKEAAGVVYFDMEKCVIAFRDTKACEKQVRGFGEKKALVTRGLVPGNPSVKGQVSAHLQRCFASVASQVFDLIRTHYTPGQSLILTGAGSGGALAILFTQVIPLIPDSWLDGPIEITSVYTFGSHKIGDDIWVKDFSSSLKKKVFRVADRSDLTVNLPDASGWFHLGEEKIVEFSRDSGETDRCFQYVDALISALRNAGDGRSVGFSGMDRPSKQGVFARSKTQSEDKPPPVPVRPSHVRSRTMDYVDPSPVSPRGNEQSPHVITSPLFTPDYASEGTPSGMISPRSHERPGSGYKSTTILVKKDKFKTLPVQQQDGQQQQDPLLFQGNEVPTEGSDRKFLLARSHTNPITRRQSGVRQNRMLVYRPENGPENAAAHDLSNGPVNAGTENLDDMINKMYFPTLPTVIESPVKDGEHPHDATAQANESEKNLFLSLKEPPPSAISRRRDSTANLLPPQSPPPTTDGANTHDEKPREEAASADLVHKPEPPLFFDGSSTAGDDASSPTKPLDASQGATLTTSLSSTNPFRPKPLPARKVTDPNAKPPPLPQRAPWVPQDGHASPNAHVTAPPNHTESPTRATPHERPASVQSIISVFNSNTNNESGANNTNNPASNTASPSNSNVKLASPLSPRGSQQAPRRDATSQPCIINNPFYQPPVHSQQNQLLIQPDSNTGSPSPQNMNNNGTTSPKVTPSSPTHSPTNPFHSPSHLSPTPQPLGLALAMPARGSNSRISVSKIDSLNNSNPNALSPPPSEVKPKLERNTSLNNSRSDLPALPPRPLSKSSTDRNLPVITQATPDKVSGTGGAVPNQNPNSNPTANPNANLTSSGGSGGILFLPPSVSCPQLPLHRTSTSKALPTPLVTTPMSPGRNPFSRELTNSGGSKSDANTAPPQQQAVSSPEKPQAPEPTSPGRAVPVDHVAWLPESAISPRLAFLTNPTGSTSPRNATTANASATNAVLFSPAPSFEIPPMPTVDSIWLPGDSATSGAAATKKVQLPSSLAAQITASLTCVLDNLRLISSVKTRDVFQSSYLKVSDAQTNLKYLLGLVSSSNMDPAIVSLDSKINQIIDLSNAVLMACFDIDTEEGDFSSRTETNSIQNISLLVNEVLALL